MGFFVLLFFLSFSSFANAELAATSEIEVVNHKNWEDHSQFLLEPLARIISTGRLEILVAPESSQKSELDFNTAKIFNNGLGIYSFSRTTISDRGVFRNQGSLMLASSTKGGEEVSHEKELSLLALSPDVLKDWLYSAKLVTDKNQSSNSFRIHTSLNRCRQIHFENVYDEIFSAPISFNDFNQDFESQANVEEEEVDRKTLLVPIPLKEADLEAIDTPLKNLSREQIIKSFSESNCEIALSAPISRKVSPLKKIIFNSAQARISAVKKEVSIIKRRPKASFADIGFELIIADPETKLPFIRLVYNSKINFVRGIFYYWQEAVVASEPTLLLDGLLSVDKDGNLFFEANLLEGFPGFNKDCIGAKFKTLCPETK